MIIAEPTKTKKGESTASTLLLTEEEMTHDSVVRMFAVLAQDPRTTSYTINAMDNSRLFDDPLRTLSCTSDESLLSRMSFSCETYEDVGEWATNASLNDRYTIAGSFHFSNKWCYIEVRPDGVFSVLHRRDAPDFKTMLDDAEEMVMRG